MSLVEPEPEPSASMTTAWAAAASSIDIAPNRNLWVALINVLINASKADNPSCCRSQIV
jgi:hypothetical protein